MSYGAKKIKDADMKTNRGLTDLGNLAVENFSESCDKNSNEKVEPP